MAVLGKVRCAILGSRGLVAQRYLQRLVNHNWFAPVSVIGSESTVGMEISDLPWYLDEKRPELPEIVVRGLEDIDRLVDGLREDGVQIIFSALPDNVASPLEENLVEKGFVVISHALIHRMKPNIPLVIPDVNPNHLKMIQSEELNNGFLVSCSNCMVVPIALTISPLLSNFEINTVRVTTEQSLSGGGRNLLSRGRKGLPIESSIPGEAESIVREIKKIFGTLHDDEIKPLDIDIEAWCSRVKSEHGHLASIEIDFINGISAHEIIQTWQNYSSNMSNLELPSSSELMQFVDGKLDAENHRWAGSELRQPGTNLCSAMSLSVGEIEVRGNKLRFKVVSDNTIRGAAGYGVLLAEFLLADGMLHDKNTVLDSDISSFNQK